jgi:aryl-alcohol dehydrogenase-like predicted oxidoreductase
LATSTSLTDGKREKLEASGTFRKGPKGELTELELEMSNVLEEVANKHQVNSLAPILLAWLYAKYTYCFPVIGLHDTEASITSHGHESLSIHLYSDTSLIPSLATRAKHRGNRDPPGRGGRREDRR